MSMLMSDNALTHVSHVHANVETCEKGDIHGNSALPLLKYKGMSGADHKLGNRMPNSNSDP